MTTESATIVWLAYPQNQPTFEGRFLVCTAAGEVREAQYRFFDAAWLEPKPKNTRFVTYQADVEGVVAFAFLPSPPSFAKKPLP